MTATMFFMMVVLKIPILMLLGIVRWAIKSVPEEDHSDDGGGSKGPDLPRRPRGRGPHGEPQPQAPARVRSALPRETVSVD
ncbi:MAG: hypothetical protein NTY57_04160 [Solirubrobacterales bacterium]|nr:hypothetical protein [Solirubrobacterales bacterium]